VVLGGVAVAALAAGYPTRPWRPSCPDLGRHAGRAARQAVTFDFTEAQINAYFHEFVAPTLPLHITDKCGSQRPPDRHRRAAGDLANVNIAATFDWQDTPGAPLRLTAAAIQAPPVAKPVGWVAVPTPSSSPHRRPPTVRASPHRPVSSPAMWTATVVGQ
jgi:hypothetical protein